MEKFSFRNRKKVNVFLIEVRFGLQGWPVGRASIKKMPHRGLGSGHIPNKQHAQRHTPVACALSDRRE